MLNVFPQGLEGTLVIPIFVGVLVMAALNEAWGWDFVGVVVPGYLAAVCLLEPTVAAVVMVEAVPTWALATGLDRGLTAARITFRCSGGTAFSWCSRPASPCASLSRVRVADRWPCDCRVLPRVGGTPARAVRDRAGAGAAGGEPTLVGGAAARAVPARGRRPRSWWRCCDSCSCRSRTSPWPASIRPTIRWRWPSSPRRAPRWPCW